MSDLIPQAAEQLGYPGDLVERSARARAQADGVDVDEVLRAWVGGEAVAATRPADGVPQPVDAAPVTVETAAEPEEPAVEVLAPATAAAGAGADGETAVTEPVRAGARAGLPRWLAASFIILPTFALLYAVVLPNGPACGDGGVLAVDEVTGEAVGCDGNPYGEESFDYLAAGEATFVTCAACHGADGGGTGTFPALAGGAVLETFPPGSCSDHVTWVTVGTLGWTDATGRDTYGATDKPLGGGGQMPAFGASLDEDSLRAVVLFERVTFGGEDLTEALTDCGLATGGAADAPAGGHA